MFFCEFCSFNSFSQAGIKSHLKLVHYELLDKIFDWRYIDCIHCGRFWTNRSLMYHMCWFHTKDSYSDRDFVEEPDNPQDSQGRKDYILGSYKCINCEMVLPTKYDLKLHINDEHRPIKNGVPPDENKSESVTTQPDDIWHCFTINNKSDITSITIFFYYVQSKFIIKLEDEIKLYKELKAAFWFSCWFSNSKGEIMKYIFKSKAMEVMESTDLKELFRQSASQLLIKLKSFSNKGKKWSVQKIIFLQLRTLLSVKNEKS